MSVSMTANACWASFSNFAMVVSNFYACPCCFLFSNLVNCVRALVLFAGSVLVFCVWDLVLYAGAVVFIVGLCLFFSVFIFGYCGLFHPWNCWRVYCW